MTTKIDGPASTAGLSGRTRGRLARLALGAEDDARWARPALWAVLVLAGFLYAWDLSRNGDANAFYAAAVLSGTESWKAFFYGSLDSASFITVDKPPFAFWVMGISARIFGFGSWSLLLPQAAEGVTAVAVVYAAVRRSVSSLTGERGAQAAGLIAALVLALTPITVAIDRDDNPDTMLTLLLVLGAWALIESLRSRRPVLMLALSGLAFGLAFNTKMLEGFIALPALPVVYLIAADGSFFKRLARLLPAGAILAVVTLSWMTIVDLIPKASRPFVGSSTNDTVWNLAIGYNGLGRVLGKGAGTGGAKAPRAASTAATLAYQAPRAGGGLGGGGGGGDQAGLGRMFGATLGGQISWLIPLALLAAVAMIIIIGRRHRTDLARASVMLWAGWLILEFVVLSFQKGTQHPYYASAMSPPIAALTGIGVVALFQAGRRSVRWRWVLPALVAITGSWAFILLRRTPDWNGWLPWAILVATVVAVLAMLAPRARRALLVTAGMAGLIAILAGPAAYAATPLDKTISGNNPLAGPTAAGGGARAGGIGGQFAGGAGAGADRHRGAGRDRGTGAGGTGGGAGGAGRAGGGRGATVSQALISYLVAHRDGATWLAAVPGSSTAAEIILATGGLPVMAMGGFTGNDPAPTLAQLRQYIDQGRLRYVVAGGGKGGGGGGTSLVDPWVEQNCTVVSVAGVTSTADLYRCG
jgi:4-amino-4-deoxy-L-arabinose transferase-like glycosyltransferase